MNEIALVKTSGSGTSLSVRRLRYTYPGSWPQAHVTVATEERMEQLDDSTTAVPNDMSESLSYGAVSVIGGRKEMEDAVQAKLGFLQAKKLGTFDFFGVYDGHGGAKVAKACSERMHQVVANEMELLLSGDTGPRVHEGNMEWRWKRVMERAFRRMDEEVAVERMVGSTAVVAVVGAGEVVIANCGDSRAVLSRGGVAVPLSVDHKPDRADEYERIEAAGGKVIEWNGQRILGVLATSRSIGDEYLKPYVISKPEVTVTKISETDEFLILASDGLWDVISSEVACKIGRRCFRRHSMRESQDPRAAGNRAAELAATLTKLATARGSSDNISVIVVDLQIGHRKP